MGQREQQGVFSIALLFLLLLAAPLQITAGDIRKLELEKEDNNVFVIEAELLVRANPEKVTALLTDYPQLTRLNEQILESELISTEKNTHIVRTKIRLCGFLICKTINQVQSMQLTPSGLLTATIIPEQSDFIEGKAQWSFLSEEDSTIILFNARLAPDFWIPPLINLLILKRMLENEMNETIEKLESLKIR